MIVVSTGTMYIFLTQAYCQNYFFCWRGGVFFLTSLCNAFWDILSEPQYVLLRYLEPIAVCFDLHTVLSLCLCQCITVFELCCKAPSLI